LAESTDHLDLPVSVAPLVTTSPQSPAGRLKNTAKRLLQLVITGVLPLVLATQPALALNDGQQLVVESWRLVNQSYVDPERFEEIHWKRLRQKALERSIQTSVDAYEAIDTMLAPIGDPYTRLLRPADFMALKANTEGQVSGVGLQLGIPGGETSIVVIAPLEDSPAAKAGITSGSALISVDGISTGELGLEATAARLRGPEGSSVLLVLKDPRGKTREVDLKRQKVNLQPVRQRLIESNGHRLGYLRITQFSEPVPQQVAQALEGLQDQGIEGLVLDLRNNSGGLVSAGLAVANALLDGGPIVDDTKPRRLQ